MANIFALNLLLTAKGSQVSLEVKSGDTFNGVIQSVDKFMNVKLLEAVGVSRDGARFTKVHQIDIKGSAIKYFRLLPATIDKAIEEAEIYNQQKEEQAQKNRERSRNNSVRGKDRQQDRGDRGGSRGRGGRGNSRGDNKSRR